MKPCLAAEALLGPVLPVAMPRTARLDAPGTTVFAMAHCGPYC